MDVVENVKKTENEIFEGDEWEVLYKKLRTINRRLYVLEEESDELFARIEKLEKARANSIETATTTTADQESSDELMKEIDELRKKQEAIVNDINDLKQRVTDIEDDLIKAFESIDDLKKYLDKTFAIAKKVERYLGLEGKDDVGEQQSDSSGTRLKGKRGRHGRP